LLLLVIQSADLVESHLGFRASHEVCDENGFWGTVLPSDYELRRTCVRVLVVAGMKLANYDRM
jgi:hypothetical protein